MTVGTKIVWSDQLQAHIRVEVPGARWHVGQARIARTDGRRAHVIEHLTQAGWLTRRAHRVGEQARLSRTRAAARAGGIERAAA